MHRVMCWWSGSKKKPRSLHVRRRSREKQYWLIVAVNACGVISVGWVPYYFNLIHYFSVYYFFWEQQSKSTSGSGQSYVALLRLEGIILPGSDFSAEKVIPELNDAFQDSSAKGVVIVIDSPGGSPVQASIIDDKSLP